MSDYLHGVETTEQDSFNMTITDADMSNVVIIGTAPSYLLDKENDDLPLIRNDRESVKYAGNNIDGFTLPDAVETVLTESGGANIYTINIFDNEKHTVSVDKSITFTNGECLLNETGIQNLVVKKNETQLKENKDYTFENNVITILSGGELETDQEDVTASYIYVDFSKITDSDVIGSVSSDGKRTGAQRIYDIIAKYGIIPGIIIAPGFTSKNVRTALETIAEKVRGYIYFDVPKGTTIQQAEAARTKAVDDLDLTCSSESVMMAMPYVKRYNSYQDTTTLKPLSPVLAGLRVRLDRERNTAKSIDNTASKTILGTEYPIYFKLNQTDTDSNRINALGITTVINWKGEYRIWGGRNCSYPSKNGIMTFESAKRVRNFINESIESSSFNAVGENITKGFIDEILNTINAKFSSWANPVNTKDYIIYEGEAYWDDSLNTAENLADGHIYFPYKHCPLCTTERITYNDILDITIITKVLEN